MVVVQEEGDFPNLRKEGWFEKFAEVWNSPRKLLSIVLVPIQKA